MTFIALPVLPNRPLDAFGAFNPYELWLLAILVAGASFLGYVALRVIGGRGGLAIGAAAGAMASSTVVTFDLGGRVRNGDAQPYDAAAAAILASLVMVARIGALSYAFAGAAFPLVLPALLSAGAAGALAFAALFTMHRWAGERAGVAPQRPPSPLDLRSFLRFALALTLLTVAARIIAHFYGSNGALAFAATAGLVDVDAVTLAMGSLVRAGGGATVGAGAILLAAAVDTASKTAIAFWTGGARYGGAYGAASALMLAAGASAYWLL
jgi:uncharacterized membrane protein (DUF4010 family)